jgi:NAD(P)-dependent dehydrogenase (short-subunit alcohol dehydrogenase family)
MPFTASRTVLVLGANGRFGLAAAQAFAAAGWHVIAQVRRDAAPGMPATAEQLRAPLATCADTLDGRTIDVVVHAINPIYTRWDQVLPTARAAIDLAERLDARFMLPGNLYNHGAAMPALIDEMTPQRPTTAKGRIRLALEAELERRVAAGHLRATVITAGDFFGAGGGSWLDQAIAKPIAKGRLDYPGDPELVHAWAYLPDLARAFVAIAALPGLAPFERFTFAGHSVTGHAFLAALERAAESLGLAATNGWRHGRLPWALLRAVGVVVPLWRELARMSYLWRVPHALDGRRLAGRCPDLVATPLEEALRASLVALGLGRDRSETQVAARPADIPATPFPRAGQNNAIGHHAIRGR